MICYLYPEPAYVFFTTGVPDLLYYSHIPTTIFAILIGLFIYLNNRKLLLNKLLFLITLCFSLWVTLSLFAWTNIHGDFILFIWPYFGILSALLSILSIYFVYVFLHQKDISFKLKIVFFTLLAPLLIFASSNLNLTGLNITYCDPYGFEGIIYKYYYIFVSLLSLVWIPILLIRKYTTSDSSFKKQILLLGTGIQLFLLSFFFATFIASYLSGIGALHDSRIEFFGLFGVLIFVGFLGVLITKFNTFRVGLIASQGLVVALVILISSQFTFLDSNTGLILNAFTLILTSTIGIVLIRSVKKEVRQRKEIEGLVDKLEQANVRLQQTDKLKSEFVSIASHQLRSPITAISGYASLMREGSYGQLTEKLKEPVERIEQSARMMASSIEDYLNVSRIESGNMKYNLTDLNIAEQAEHIADDLRSEALKRGLIILFKKKLTSRGVVHADLGKVQQIIHNLLNNAIKYTPKGTITVYAHDDLKLKKVYIDIIDTGMGMGTETLHSIFQKFERGDKANAINVKGTGLGLYVALKMAEAMGGTITAKSEGEGSGSVFTLELPIQL
jgi:signal transduction histidine kinase